MNLIDPETWKPVAALVEDWRVILVGIAAIISAVGGAFRWGLKPSRWTFSRVKNHPNKRPQDEVPKDALRFVQNEQQSFWGPTQHGKEVGTQIHGHWHVTNIVKDWNFVLLHARLAGHDHKNEVVFTSGFRDRPYSQLTPVIGGKMAQVDANLFFFPAITSGEETLAADVIFIDNYGQEHRVPSRFRYIRG